MKPRASEGAGMQWESLGSFGAELRSKLMPKSARAGRQSVLPPGYTAFLISGVSSLVQVFPRFSLLTWKAGTHP